MEKKILLFVMLLTAVTAKAIVYNPGDDLNYEYDDENKTATVIEQKSTYKIDTYHVGYYNTYCGDIVIPETAPNGYTVVAIGDGAFKRSIDTRHDPFPTITSVVIPSTVKKIGNNAFADCDSLKTISIPASVEQIHNNVFVGSGITSITIEDSDNTLILGNNSYANTTSLGGSFDFPCDIYVGRNITCLDVEGTFKFADKIVNITYGPKVTKFNTKECWRSSSIKTVKILSTAITDIPADAFGECSALETINLPEGLVSIQNDAFLWDKNLKDIVLPSTLKTIGNEAFNGCFLSQQFTIPASVEVLGDKAFCDNGITSLIIADSDTPLTIGGGTITNNTLLGSMFASMAKVYVGRNIIAAEGKGPFQFTGKVEEITYGPKVTALTIKECWRNTSVKKVDMKASAVTIIPENAFSESEALQTVILPASLKSVDNNAFWNASSLAQIYANPVVPPTCGSNVFNYVDKKACSLFVPRGSLEDYQNAPVWKEFFNIEEMAETKCKTPTATIENGHLKFSCETKGVTYHYEGSYPQNFKGEGEGDDVAIGQTIHLTLYATRAGLEDSDVAEYDLVIAGGSTAQKGDVNEDGTVDVADIATIITIMAKS